MDVVNVIEAKKMIDERLGSEDFEFIDVRTPMEYNAGHVDGSRLMPLDEIDQWADSLDENKTYLIMCRSGGRSGMACQFLAQKGVSKTINMMGGILDWEEEGFPIEK